MTEEALDTEISSSPETNPEMEMEQEKMIPVSRVEELIKKAKLKGRDHLQQEMDAVRAENENLKQQASMGGMPVPLDEKAITDKIMADLNQRFQQANETRAHEELQREATRVADEYKAKMNEGNKSYSDFDDVMSDFNPEAFPNLVYLANQVDNTPQVMYELMKNPSKWATVAVLSERDPRAAQNMLTRISTSIKANEQAKALEKDVPPPLTRLSSSTAGQDSGKLTLNDMKRKFKG